ncbi:unnamed protein product [Boreogadus saida]
MWLVLRAELRECLRLKFSPTKTIVSASLEGERNNGDTWRFPVVSHTRAAVESASLHRQEPTCSFRTDISDVTTWFLCLFSDYAILLDSFRIIQASANHLYPELRQAQRHGERAQPRNNCLVVAMDVACEGLHSELSPSSSDSELIRTGHGCDGERTPDHTPVDLDGYRISVGVRVKAITGPGQAVGKHFGSYVFSQGQYLLRSPTSGSETCGDRMLPSPPVSPAHGSLAAAVMIHRLAFGLRLNTLCGGTSDPWEALDEEEYVFDYSALKRLTNGPFRTRI